jgi:type II secretory pathway component PulM
MENPTPDVKIDEPRPEPGEAVAEQESKSVSETAQPRRNVLARMYDPQTKFGRFMRGLTRALAVIVGLFALGMLVTYLMLYRPLADEASGLRTQLAQSQQQAGQLQQDLSKAQQDILQFKKSNTELITSLDKAEGNQAVLTTLSAINLARYQLASGKTADAKSALDAVPAALDDVAKAAGGDNIAQIADIRSRLALAAGEMERDPQTAQSDLGILVTQLTDLGKKLSK